MRAPAARPDDPAPPPQAAAAPPRGAFDDLPGEPMMWLLIGSELLVFGGGLLGFLGARALDPATFAAGQATLDRTAGALNTLALVTSGYCAARAAQAAAASARAGGVAPDPRAASRTRLWLARAAALGLLFLAVKTREYAAHAAHGVGIETDAFFTLYYLLTGFHALHVVAGVVILALVSIRGAPGAVEAGAQFWHMVDLVWVLLFPVIYLLR